MMVTNQTTMYPHSVAVYLLAWLTLQCALRLVAFVYIYARR